MRATHAKLDFQNLPNKPNFAVNPSRLNNIRAQSSLHSTTRARTTSHARPR